ncbi:hypothetical protein [Erythrobacter sp.]|jgi:hypothetical protein|uniref:hypothetical protein n=1 Tax=Erythrobacter sp. TaxID=1042 RepID=UPI002E9EC53B|nr:hypothetical protein [Erythrobacter sp.]
MKLIVLTATAAALIAAPTPSAACNPDAGCGGVSAEELARDRAETRRLNREQKRYVDQRDARYARGWAAQERYERALDDYEGQMARWREAVRRCEAGDWNYCGF